MDLTNNGIGNHYLRDVNHGSTVSCVSQDSIFHIPVRLDIWRCRTTRINVRLNAHIAQHRKTTNSNGNQVCRVFSRTQWERILFVCYEISGFDLAPNITQSSDDRHRDPWSVDHRWEIHCSLEATHGYLFENRYAIEIMWKFLRIVGNWKLTKILKIHNLCYFKNDKDCEFSK